MFSDFTQRSKVISQVISPIESKRFGISVTRLNIPLQHSITDNEIVEICAESKSELLILRYPSNRTQISQALSQIPSKLAFQADTLVYFSKSLENFDPEFFKTKDFHIRTAGLIDMQEIQALAGSTFDGYSNHYQANYFLKPEAIRLGFQEWAVSSLTSENSLVVVAEDESSSICGFGNFACVGDDADFLLSGVDERFQGRGIYSEMIRFASNELSIRGVKSLFISTQIQNRSAIRAWIRAGFNLDFSLNTFHVMPREK
jgi:ribosomal protein S18 acetylase RimI-like enzyme